MIGRIAVEFELDLAKAFYCALDKVYIFGKMAFIPNYFPAESAMYRRGTEFQPITVEKWCIVIYAGGRYELIDYAGFLPVREHIGKADDLNEPVQFLIAEQMHI